MSIKLTKYMLLLLFLSNAALGSLVISCGITRHKKADIMRVKYLPFAVRKLTKHITWLIVLLCPRSRPD